MPALLAAQEIAGAADLQVERRHAEAAAEIAELLDRRQPLARNRRQRLLRRNQQVGVRGTVRPAHTASELVQLRESVPVRAVDDDRVRVRDVEAVLDDRGREQDVEPPLHEAKHRPLELVLAHLTVTDHDLRFRDETPQQVSNGEDGFDAVVHEVDLAAARQLVPDGALDHRRIELHHVRLNREPVLGRRLDNRHVADADERHVQRPRNRRRGHRQHVDPPSHLLDALLMGDAKPLLFVDHEQAEVLELHVLGQESMRADDDVDFARGEAGKDLLCFLLRAEAADHVDRHREAGKPLAKRLQVLKRQDGRRREKCGLLAVHHGLERGAHRHFGLAVANVAAEEAIHRRGRLHVPFDVCDRGDLVGRQLVRKRPLEFLLPMRVG